MDKNVLTTIKFGSFIAA